MKTPSVCFTRSRWLCAALLAVILCVPRLTSASTLIYSDDFSGLSSATLDGTSPDVSSGTLGGSASATWIADTVSFKANGTVTGQAGNVRYALLAFTPVVGNIYTLTIDLNTADAASVNWLGAGFTSNTATSTNSTALNSAWVSYAAKGVGNAYASGSTPFTTGATFGTAGTVSDPITLTITLDTTAAQWTTTYSALNLSTSTVLGTGSFTYTTNPTITSIFIGDIIYGGVVDNLSLTATPEPNSIALLGMALLVSGSLIRLRAARSRG